MLGKCTFSLSWIQIDRHWFGDKDERMRSVHVVHITAKQVISCQEMKMAVKCPQMNISQFVMLLSPSLSCFKLTVMINLEQVCLRVYFCQGSTKMSQW